MNYNKSLFAMSLLASFLFLESLVSAAEITIHEDLRDAWHKTLAMDNPRLKTSLILAIVVYSVARQCCELISDKQVYCYVAADAIGATDTAAFLYTRLSNGISTSAIRPIARSTSSAADVANADIKARVDVAMAHALVSINSITDSIPAGEKNFAGEGKITIHTDVKDAWYKTLAMTNPRLKASLIRAIAIYSVVKQYCELSTDKKMYCYSAANAARAAHAVYAINDDVPHANDISSCAARTTDAAYAANSAASSAADDMQLKAEKAMNQASRAINMFVPQSLKCLVALHIANHRADFKFNNLGDTLDLEPNSNF